MESEITLKSLWGGQYRTKRKGVRVPIKKGKKKVLSTYFIPIVCGVTGV
jgi:hypothetical protein